MPKATKADTSQVQTIRKMRADGATFGKIARHLNLPLEKVRRLVLRNTYRETLHELPGGKPLPEPSSPKEAREWLEAAGQHLSEWPYASHRLRFVGYALLEYLKEEGKGEPSLFSALALEPRKRGRGRPRNSHEVLTSIVEMLRDEHPLADISKVLEVPKSRIRRVKADVNAILGLRQHGAKPDALSLADARDRAAKIPHERLITILSAMISSKDILPE